MKWILAIIVVGWLASLGASADSAASPSSPWMVAHASFAATDQPGAEAIDFAVFGDCRNNLDTAARAIGSIIEEAPAFVLATGDYVNDGANLEEWMAFRKVIAPLMQSVPLYTAVGNHDRQGRGRRIDYYRDTFTLPTGPDNERYYNVDYGSLRVIVLDSNSYANAAQTEWLTNTLHEGAQMRRKMFVVMHHPVYSISLHGGHEKIRETWAPLFEHYGVQAVFSGHDHVYARAEAGGVRYFITGGAGAPLYGKSRNPNPLDVQAVKKNARVNHYIRVHVLENLIEVTAVKLDGSIIERVRWELVAAAGGDARARTTMSVLSDLMPGMYAPSASDAAPSQRRSNAPLLWPHAASSARHAGPSTWWLLLGLAVVLVAAVRLARLGT